MGVEARFPGNQNEKRFKVLQDASVRHCRAGSNAHNWRCPRASQSAAGSPASDARPAALRAVGAGTVAAVGRAHRAVPG